MAGDLYSLLMGSDQDAEASAAALAAAIRGNRATQMAGALGSPNAITAMGAAAGGQAAQDANLVEKGLTSRMHYGQAAQEAKNNALRMTLEARAREGDLNRQTSLLRAAMSANARTGVGIPGVSDDTLESWSKSLELTGQVPPLPRGIQTMPVRDEITRRVVARNPSWNQAVAAAGYAADKGSLTKLQTQREMLGAFEETAKRNIGILKEYVAKIPNTGIPALNRPVRALAKAMGDTDMAGYDIALRTVQREASRILETANAQGIITNDARQALEHDISSASSPEQMMEVLGVLDRDFTNRMAATDEGISKIKTRIGGGAVPAPAGAKIRVRQKSTGQTGTIEASEFDPNQYERVQ